MQKGMRAAIKRQILELRGETTPGSFSKHLISNATVCARLALAMKRVVGDLLVGVEFCPSWLLMLDEQRVVTIRRLVGGEEVTAA